MFSVVLAPVEDIPELGALVLRIPLTEVITVGEETLLGAGFLFVTSRATDSAAMSKICRRDASAIAGSGRSDTCQSGLSLLLNSHLQLREFCLFLHTLPAAFLFPQTQRSSFFRGPSAAPEQAPTVLTLPLSLSTVSESLLRRVVSDNESGRRQTC